jgi:hypothetical protein
MNKLLHKLYYDIDSGYIGAVPLFKKAQLVDKSIKQSDINKWYYKQGINQIHHKSNKKGDLPIFSSIGDSYQIDLAFLPKYKSVNKGYEVILTCININTRKAFAYKSKRKDSDSILALIKQFVDDSNAKTITSDNGSEFINSKVQDYFKNNNIVHHLAEPEDHNLMGKIERFNRTLKEKLDKIFTSIEEPIWFDILDKVITNYNNTYHSVIKQSPNRVTKADEAEIIKQSKMKTNNILEKRNELIIGNTVRIIETNPFGKTGSQFSDEVYTIDKVTGLSSYRIRNSNNKLMRKLYKYEELLVVNEIENPKSRNKIKTIAKSQLDRNKVKFKEGLENNNIFDGTRKHKVSATQARKEKLDELNAKYKDVVFVDDGDEFKIIKIYFSRNKYLVDYTDKEGNIHYSMLKEIEEAIEKGMQQKPLRRSTRINNNNKK